MRRKHSQFDERYASVFGDASVVDAYRYRPPYPPETFELLNSLSDPKIHPRTVLDAGGGPGTIARSIVGDVDRVDAVDIAKRMIEAGIAAPNGDHPNLRWLQGSIEEVPLTPPYSLVVTAASLHWMHWETVMKRFHEVLTPGGFLAIVDEESEPPPWEGELSLISEYSLNRHFKPYSMMTVCAELEERLIFKRVGTRTTSPILFRQSVDEYVESFHARNGLSRDRLTHAAAEEFGHRLRDAVLPHCPEGTVELKVSSKVIWGRPCA